MLYPVELRAQNLAFTYENVLQLQQQRVVLSREIPSHNFGRLHTDCDLKDRRLTFQVHGRKIFLVPLRRQGGPYYIRFEPPSNCRKGIRVVHRSPRTGVVAAAKARAKLIIEPILNGQWEVAEKLKSKSGYATIGDIIERYHANAQVRAATIRNNISAMRLLLRTVYETAPDGQSSSVLAADLIRSFERARLSSAKTEIARRRVRPSIATLRLL